MVFAKDFIKTLHESSNVQLVSSLAPVGTLLRSWLRFNATDNNCLFLELKKMCLT